MVTNSHCRSAEIYDFAEFAAKLRPTAEARDDEGRRAIEAGAPRFPMGEFGDAWYHQAAIREAEEDHKH